MVRSVKGPRFVTRGNIITSCPTQFLNEQKSHHSIILAFFCLRPVREQNSPPVKPEWLFFFFLNDFLFSSQVKERPADPSMGGCVRHLQLLLIKEEQFQVLSCWQLLPCQPSFLCLYHLEFLLSSEVQSHEGVWSQAWDPLPLSLWHCIPGREGLFGFLPPSPTLLAVYNKLLSCIQKKQALRRLWLCCLELFTTYFGLSRQGRKYTVNLPDSESSHLGPQRLTTCGNTETPSFLHQPAVCKAGPLWLGSRRKAGAAPSGHFLSLHSLPNTWCHPCSFLALGKVLSVA